MAAYEVPSSRVGKGTIVSQGWGREEVTVFRNIALPAAFNNSNTNSVGLFEVPSGSIVTSMTIDFDDMDSGGTALRLTVGDVGSTARLIAATDAGTAAGTATLKAGAYLTVYASKTQIRLYCSTAATTGAAGSVRVTCKYVVDPNWVGAETAVTP